MWYCFSLSLESTKVGSLKKYSMNKNHKLNFK